MRLSKIVGVAALVLVGLSVLAAAPQPKRVRAAAVDGLITGEIIRMTLTNRADVWSAGSIEVGGQNVILPRNLLIDFPANRLTLQQTFAQAPPACVTNGESGLAQVDTCNTLGQGGIATIAATRTTSGDLIAGDVFFQKGAELVAGRVTYLNLTDGYFRLNGNPNDANTGVMVRLNDPTGRHTMQQGFGCGAGPNCSADPRFTEDPDNYTQAFSTGYPLCLPSAVARTFVDALDFNNNGNTTETLTAQSAADGTGDLLCPATNRTSLVAADSRRLAPIQLGDHLTVQGNFELIGGAWYLSAWNTRVSRALSTNGQAGQPDYMTISEMFIDAPAYQRNRIRDLFLGYTTAVTSDVMLWSIHRDPLNNAAHEFPLGSVAGCDLVAGAATCTGVLGPNSFRVEHRTDFAGGAKSLKTDACAQLRADPRLAAANICPQGGTVAEEFAILSPLPHEVQARTGLKIADLARPGGPILRTLDLRGSDASNGQYLFPMGIGLGGIELPTFVEINIDKLDTATSFSGIPWNLDRRLSPNGCNGPCESTPQPLDPFPFEGFDPRTQSTVPTTAYTDPNFTASPLTNTSNRILSFVDPALGKFNGNSTVLAWPPVDPAAQPITPALPPIAAPPGPVGATAPGAPTAVTATAGNAQATLTWTAPSSNGGSAITSYTIASSPAGAVIPAVGGGATSATVTGLTNGTTYTFTVTATNGVGAGPASAPSNAVTPAATPGAPTAVTATAGNAQATVNWTAPAAGGSAITGYTVTASPGGATASVGAVTTATVNGLTNGTTYTFTVTATNTIGTGSASTPSNTVTPSAGPPPPAAPAAPGIPAQTLAAGSAVSVASPLANSAIPVTVSWTPSSTGGVTSYQLQQSTSGGAFADVSPQPAGTATTLTLNLPLGSGAPQSTYQFQVRACAGATCSAWATGPVVSALPLDNSSASIAFSGGWKALSVTGAYGGTVQNQTASNKRATLAAQTFTATGNLAWVSTLGPDRGQATVSVDGGPATTVDLFAATTQAAQVVFVSNNLAPGSHTLVITVRGISNAASTGTRVDVDAIIVIH